MLDEARFNDLWGQVYLASWRDFPTACTNFFDHIRTNVSPSNPAFRKLEGERKTRWAKWGNRARKPNERWIWSFPESPEDRVSLAWHLFRLVGEEKDTEDDLIYDMYPGHWSDVNLLDFKNDWEDYLMDALLQVLRFEEAPAEKHAREKQQKFAILDAPNLLAADLAAPIGLFGRVILYLDLDDFKAINTKLTERVVHQHVLRPVHRLLASCMQSIGFAYAEGGDEFVLLVQNCTQEIGILLADAVRDRIASLRLQGPAAPIALSVSVGVAHQAREEPENDLVVNRANEAKQFAKENGKNCVALWTPNGCRIAAGTATRSSA